MLDPGRYLAEAIYFVQYTVAQILWAIDRALLSIAVIAESIDSWLITNTTYFVELVVNALAAPLGGMLILALMALGSWYLLNNIVATERWVDPSKLIYAAGLALFFFASPVAFIGGLEQLRTSINSGIDPALVAAASGDVFATTADGTDTGLPSAIADTNSDGVIASFDLVAAFVAIGNLTELDNSEFPLDFEAAYFPFGDPSSINLADEADREAAKSLASAGIQRLLFALLAIPTAIAEHFLRLALTGSAMFLYLGAPVAMLLAFFIFTQAYLSAYVRQFVRLLIETFFSVIIIIVAIILLVAAAGKGVGFYIGASLIAFVLLLWRIRSALQLAAASVDLFGGSMLTGGAGGMQLVNSGRQMLTGTAALAGAALTGGATLAVGGAALASVAALNADARHDGRYLRTNPEKAAGRVRQLKTISGYAFGKNQSVRKLIESSHEVRTLTRNLRDGEAQEHAPDSLDYLRAGASMSGFGSSPWLAMRLSPSLRTAFNQIGGEQAGGHPLAYDIDDAPLAGASPTVPTGVRSNSLNNGHAAALEQAIWSLTDALNNVNLGQSQADGQQTASRRASASIHLATRDDDNGAGATVNSAENNHSATPNPPNSSDTATRSAASVSAENHPPSNGTIHLNRTQPSHRASIQRTFSKLQDTRPSIRRTAAGLLTGYVGEQNSNLLQAAVRQHSADAANRMVDTVDRVVNDYRNGRLSEAEILDRFHSGAAFDAVRALDNSPLDDQQIAAVADIVLLPYRQITRRDLVGTIAQQAQTANADDQSVAAALDSPVGFAGQTGNVRGILSGTRALNLTPQQVANMADQIGQGMRVQVANALIQQGASPDVANELIADIAALPDRLIIPQTTAVSNREEDGNET